MDGGGLALSRGDHMVVAVVCANYTSCRYYGILLTLSGLNICNNNNRTVMQSHLGQGREE